MKALVRAFIELQRIKLARVISRLAVKIVEVIAPPHITDRNITVPDRRAAMHEVSKVS